MTVVSTKTGGSSNIAARVRQFAKNIPIEQRLASRNHRESPDFKNCSQLCFFCFVPPHPFLSFFFFFEISHIPNSTIDYSFAFARERTIARARVDTFFKYSCVTPDEANACAGGGTEGKHLVTNPRTSTPMLMVATITRYLAYNKITRSS